MVTPPMTDADVIDILGGTEAVRALTGVTAMAVSQWRKSGIPPARRNQFAEAMLRGGHAVPVDWYQRNRPRNPNRVAAHQAPAQETSNGKTRKA